MGKELVRPALQSVYYTISNGRKEYGMVDYTSQEKFNVIDWINENKDIDNLNEEETDTNAIVNTVED